MLMSGVHVLLYFRPAMMDTTARAKRFNQCFTDKNLSNSARHTGRYRFIRIIIIYEHKVVIDRECN